MPDISIRELCASDTDAVVAIAVAAWEPIYGLFREVLGDEAFTTMHPDWQADKGQQVRSACEGDRAAGVFVAETGGRVIGFVTCYADVRPSTGEIGNNAVHPDFQGRGIGPRLYERAFQCLRERGMRYVMVRTGLDPSHAPARRAYAKAGFHTQLPTVTLFREL